MMGAFLFVLPYFYRRQVDGIVLTLAKFFKENKLSTHVGDGPYHFISLHPLFHFCRDLHKDSAQGGGLKKRYFPLVSSFSILILFFLGDFKK
jgi:hypothetical protein